MKFIFKVTFLLLTLSACSLGSSEVIPSDFKNPEMVEVSFQVLIPEGSDISQGITFTLLDRLTGEEINPKHLLMNQDSERSFSIRFSVVRHSLISYRYERGEVDRTREANSKGIAINHRIYFVDGPGHVATDLIAAWEGDLNNLEMGSIRGRIVDSENKEIPGNLIVNVSGQEIRSNQKGEFFVEGLIQGLHRIVVYSDTGEYLVFQQGALVGAGLETPAEIIMQASETIKVDFIVGLPDEHVPGVPVFLINNVGQSRVLHSNGMNAEGKLLFSADLPVGLDIRYKYSLGDGFWNAEHLENGEYLSRQVVLQEDKEGLVIHDEIANWMAGNSAPIWFEALNPDLDSGAIFIQFKFIDWTPAIQMWGLGGGVFAYKLNSPTNFAAPLEYRYCLDKFCVISEDAPASRNVEGNLEKVQYIEDQINGWK